jgi:GTPase SAR1 family protein
MKVLVLGDEDVGKRSLINSLFASKYSRKRIAIYSRWDSTGFMTLNYLKQIGSYPIKFQIWILNPLLVKIPGKRISTEKPYSKRLGKVYCYGALGAMVIYDVTNRRSFTSVKKWIKLVWDNNGKGMIPLTIVANKIDLDENSFKTRKKGKNLVEKITKQTQPLGFKVNYIETSLTDNKQVIEGIFYELGQSYIEYIELCQKKEKS